MCWKKKGGEGFGFSLAGLFVFVLLIAAMWTSVPLLYFHCKNGQLNTVLSESVPQCLSSGTKVWQWGSKLGAVTPSSWLPVLNYPPSPLHLSRTFPWLSTNECGIGELTFYARWYYISALRKPSLRRFFLCWKRFLLILSLSGFNCVLFFKWSKRHR